MEKVERKSGRGLARTKRAKEQLGWQTLTFERSNYIKPPGHNECISP